MESIFDGMTSNNKNLSLIKQGVPIYWDTLLISLKEAILPYWFKR